MARRANLIMVTENNNNKFYNMIEEGNQIRIEYGRVGAAVRTCFKPISQWDKVYHEKTGKGYQDITHLKEEPKVNNQEYKPIEEVSVKEIVDLLIRRSRQMVEKNYLVDPNEVSKYQIDVAQDLIIDLSRVEDFELSTFNTHLKELFTILPRKMKKVNDHLVPPQPSREDEIKAMQELIAFEQSLLDNMRTTVYQIVDDEFREEQGEIANQTILEANGLQFREATAQEIEFIKGRLDRNAHQLSRVWVVNNDYTEQEYLKDKNSAKNKDVAYFWHGSRTENWWSIINSGLKIRPANAAYTGSMFGDGLYFANKAQKSINYTSLNNSYWAGGKDKVGYLALYEVRVGSQYHVHTHTSECYNYSKKFLKTKGDYDSVYAHAGSSLVNSEFIIYDSSQCTVRYLVEIKSP